MVGLIKYNENRYRFCFFKDDADARSQLTEMNHRYNRCAVAYECLPSGLYRLIDGWGEYTDEPYPENPGKLQGCSDEELTFGFHTP